MDDDGATDYVLSAAPSREDRRRMDVLARGVLRSAGALCLLPSSGAESFQEQRLISRARTLRKSAYDGEVLALPVRARWTEGSVALRHPSHGLAARVLKPLCGRGF